MADGSVQETETLGQWQAVEFAQPIGQVLVEGLGHALGRGQVQQAGSGLVDGAAQ
ncbi:hypothetical protein ACFC0M_06645 [Streptomyces sp. NPDC056149]|uniref:hypothetical protein n=1 Tax=Streptomyces sp. NPDC056149 TaxID=3345728 RepID=UPI0035D85BAD